MGKKSPTGRVSLPIRPYRNPTPNRQMTPATTSAAEVLSLWGSCRPPERELRHRFGVDLLDRVEQEFITRRESGALERAFTGWTSQHRCLERFSRLETLIAECRDGSVARDGTDAALAALCEEARTGDQCACVLLIWLLLPGLLLARSRVVPVGGLSREELTADMLAAVWEQVTEVTPSTSRVAARLLNAARWRGLAAMKEAADWARRKDSSVVDRADETRLSDYVSLKTDLERLPETVGDGEPSREHVRLVLAGRQALRELSEQLGISLQTAQKRRQRARARLRSWIEPTGPQQQSDAGTNRKS